MFYKLAILVICATLTGMALLMLRHHVILRSRLLAL